MGSSGRGKEVKKEATAGACGGRVTARVRWPPYLQPQQPPLLSVFGREESQVSNFHVEPNHIASLL